MDELAGVHVAKFGRGHLQTQFLGLFIKEGLLDKLAPDALTDAALHLGGNLGDLLLHLVVVLGTLHELVETLTRHRLAVHFTHVGDTTIVLGQIAKDEGDDSNANEGNGNPRMLSNTSDNSHFVSLFFSALGALIIIIFTYYFLLFKCAKVQRN